MEHTNFSRAILNYLWLNEVMKAAVLFLKSNEHASNGLQQNTTDSAQDTSLELHTWYPYENSDRCNPAEGTVPVKVFTVRNLSDIRRSDIFRGYVGKNFHGCPIKVYVRVLHPLLLPPKRVWYNESYYQDVYEDGWEIEMLKSIGKAKNMSLHIATYGEVVRFMIPQDGKLGERLKGKPFILVGWYPGLHSELDYFSDYTRSYFSLRFAWYTPCAVKYRRWSRLFNIFSVDMWISFALSLVLAVITVRCISNYRHKSHLHEPTSYSNLFSVTANIIAVLLSVSVSTQPRSAPLRLFFFSWVCYSVAISTVFQAYLTTFLIEPGYEETIKSRDEMLKSEKKLAFVEAYKTFFNDISDPVDSSIRNQALHCYNEYMCFTWAAVYHNISTIMYDLEMENYRRREDWTDGNNRPVICELEDGVVRTIGLAIAVRKRSPFFEVMDNVVGRIVEGGIFMQIKKMGFVKENVQTKFDLHMSEDTNSALNIRQLQTAFYLLMLGYVLAGVCFVTEIMWHCYRSRVCEPTGTSLCHVQA
jgi:hypothetical protein